MEQVLLGIIAFLCLLVFVIVLVLLLKNNKNTSQLTQNQIKKAVNEAVSEMNTIINQGILNQHQIYFNRLDDEVKKLNDSLAKLERENHEFQLAFLNQSKEAFKDLFNKLDEFKNTLAYENKVSINEFTTKVELRLTKIEQVVSSNLKDIREDNNHKLDQIKGVVDEKLSETLENKINKSFANIIEQFAMVNTAIGEIKGIATDVGSLKTVLTNVKTKGILGEVILGNLIKEVLNASQYEENISFNNSRDTVEYAIKMPGVNDEFVYLPVDSKFPTEGYQRILKGIEDGNKLVVEEERKKLRNDIRKFAKDIATKYINVPKTTDFAIMFIPLEGLYAELINLNLLEELMHDFKIVISGPSTFLALLNALQMGFKTLVIQKKSAEAFKLLAAVKVEFEKFQVTLDKAKKKVNEATIELETLSNTRTKAITKKLSNLESISNEEAEAIIYEDN